MSYIETLISVKASEMHVVIYIRKYFLNKHVFIQQKLKKDVGHGGACLESQPSAAGGIVEFKTTLVGLDIRLSKREGERAEGSPNDFC